MALGHGFTGKQKSVALRQIISSDCFWFEISCNPAILPSHPGCGKTSTSSGENRPSNREILHWLAIGWHLRQSGSRTNHGSDQIAALPAPLK
jgi:hypothetical protein